MFAFLGWLTILREHENTSSETCLTSASDFGPNVAVFPFFALDKPTADVSSLHASFALELTETSGPVQLPTYFAS